MLVQAGATASRLWHGSSPALRSQRRGSRRWRAPASSSAHRMHQRCPPTASHHRPQYSVHSSFRGESLVFRPLKAETFSIWNASGELVSRWEICEIQCGPLRWLTPAHSSLQPVQHAFACVVRDTRRRCPDSGLHTRQGRPFVPLARANMGSSLHWANACACSRPHCDDVVLVS